MADCCNVTAYRDLFDEKEARRNLRRYERKGLDELTRSMVDYLVSRGMEGRSVLEAGGGIGAIQIELLQAGAASAANVELSGEYEPVAGALLERTDLADRVHRLVGDFTDLASDLDADTVVLNDLLLPVRRPSHVSRPLLEQAIRCSHISERPSAGEAHGGGGEYLLQAEKN